jgi:AcrR family transcriptional regulator
MPAPVGREKLPREIREQHQRDRVLDEATAVFAKRGYVGATVDHVIAAAGIGVGGFYKLFDGKEDCFLQAYDRIAADTRERLRAAAPPDGSASAQVSAGLRVLLDRLAADPLAARLALVEVQTAGPRACARHESNLDAAIPVLRRCRRQSPFADELPTMLEQSIVGGVAWLLHQRLEMSEIDHIEDLFPELVDIVLGPYLGEAEASRLASTS